MMEFVQARVHNPEDYKAPESPRVMAAVDVELISEPTTKAPAAAPSSSSHRPSLPGWNFARPLNNATPPEDAATNEHQLKTLEKARTMIKTVWSRMPNIEQKSAAGTEKGYRVLRERDGCVSVNIIGHPLCVAEATFDVHFVDTWTTDIVLRAKDLGTGLLPLMAMLREPDLIADYLPHPAGLPFIEGLDIDKTFHENDWMYHCFVSPFGPLPGADDLHAITLFDLMDEPEGAIVLYAESPKEGAKEHRGWPIPKVTSWRRQRNFVLGATTVIKPSSARPVSLDPPSSKPAKCASPGCRFHANPALSIGGGLYCCLKCKEKGPKHAAPAYCQKREFPDENIKWSLAEHGCIDVELAVTIKFPIPTWLIPLAFVRWVAVKIIKLYYPYLVLLNERFDETPFAQRVEADKDGFYARLGQQLKDAKRSFARTRENGDPAFVFKK